MFPHAHAVGAARAVRIFGTYGGNAVQMMSEKVLESADRVHPLLFRSKSSAVLPLDPKFMLVHVALRWPALARSAPVRVAFAAGRQLLRSDRSTARLQTVDFPGKRSAAMLCDEQPIVDYFRKIDGAHVLGLMEMRGMERPYFFFLTRD